MSLKVLQHHIFTVYVPAAKANVTPSTFFLLWAEESLSTRINRSYCPGAWPTSSVASVSFLKKRTPHGVTGDPMPVAEMKVAEGGTL